jgi:methyl coenzyme M reductase subunit C-like uncharacterized protein (methanogenesis marker protein 7)
MTRKAAHHHPHPVSATITYIYRKSATLATRGQYPGATRGVGWRIATAIYAADEKMCVAREDVCVRVLMEYDLVAFDIGWVDEAFEVVAQQATVVM